MAPILAGILEPEADFLGRRNSESSTVSVFIYVNQNVAEKVMTMYEIIYYADERKYR